MHLEDWEAYLPLDRLTIFDMLDNFALPQQLERLQRTITEQTKKQTETIKTKSSKVVEEWRKRIPAPEEQFERYRSKVKSNVDRLGRRWNDTKAVTLREKMSFISGVMNVFVSGYLIGAYPEYLPQYYSMQLIYFMTIRLVTYRSRGYHYFLADLCYFVNFLCLLSIWVFPQSKRLFISTFCLAFGNNAVAIAMWRNSMVFHSLDKVTSLFIHIMPCVTLHCIVHCISEEVQKARFPAVWTMRHSLPGSPGHYSLLDMALWSTIPYAIWQLSYHFLITVRRRDQIAAGRPTSFTWLRKSYAKSWIGRVVLALPDSIQGLAFMLIQYFYALLTMLPCPVWFWYRYASASFLMAMFCLSVHNGATYYIDVFGKRFQNELEAMKREMQKLDSSSDGPTAASPSIPATTQRLDASLCDSVDQIPLLNDGGQHGTGNDAHFPNSARQRKAAERAI